MPPKAPPTAKVTVQGSKKRKDPPSSANNNFNHPPKKPRPNGSSNQTSKIRDARTLATQTTSKAFKHGGLDVDKFVKSREYEIRALEQGLVRSKKALTKRAFQQVPKELRRRTASHNVKKVPKRLQERAKREMKDDKTPTGAARRKKPTRHMRLRLETAKKLRALGAKRKATAEKANVETVTVKPIVDPAQPSIDSAPLPKPGPFKPRKPKPKRAALAAPLVPNVKFRKRQKDKSWLPTHLFHAKRARMTTPKEPLWRFSLPLTPTVKSYRPTHRAASERGAVCWDVSYVSTIALHGREASVVGMLTALGVDGAALGVRGSNWRKGKSAMEFLLHEREAPCAPIAPVVVLWCPSDGAGAEDTKKRQLFLRVHPSAFFQLWEEVLRLGKVAKPAVMVEDLRYEIGGIEVIGPASTEALLSALWPSIIADGPNDTHVDSIAMTFAGLAGLTNPAILPTGALLPLTIQDPRLYHPPRPVKPPNTPDAQQKLLERIAIWPPDSHELSPGIFDRKTRVSASSSLPSQKAINRRKALATPGRYPEPALKDPRIPALLFASPSRPRSKSQQATWHLILPWKCVQPVWYSLMYTPLSTGQQPRCGGQDEQRQLALERGQPWFPGDFPGTKAGWEWEVKEAGRRFENWKKRPKSKRTSWEAIDLGDGKKGEVGMGWACDWTRLVMGPTSADVVDDGEAMDVDPPAALEATTEQDTTTMMNGQLPPKATALSAATAAPITTTVLPVPSLFPNGPPAHLQHMPSAQAHALLNTLTLEPGLPTNALMTVRVNLLTRGLPSVCARIYRLPLSPTHRAAWLALHSRHKPPKSAARALPNKTTLATLPIHEQRRILAASLLEPARAGEEKYPACPAEDDLIGFVTSGNYDLGGGKGVGIGSLLVMKVLGRGEGMAEGGEGRYCVIRNSGESVGRLGMWEVV
ncbi:Ribonucleases P/MRP protein subunit pop1 [Oleoguttula sp. CCFEE 5521]